jgi:hypothetical protein
VYPHFFGVALARLYQENKQRLKKSAMHRRSELLARTPVQSRNIWRDARLAEVLEFSKGIQW